MANRDATTIAPATHILAWLAVGFLAGAVSVLVFHQGALGLLHGIGLTARPPYSMAPTAPWGVPQLWSLAFWGGIWGIVLALVFWRVARGARLILSAVVFGAVFPTLVAWFIVAPLKGLPMAGGGQLAPMATALLINGAWGLGVGLALALLGLLSRNSRL
jgi:hypothetical protein